MENAEKIEKMTFKDYYQSLDEERKKAVRDQFLVASGISYPTFYSKLTRENYSLLERRALETICQTSFKIMSTKEISKGSVEKALAFIESVKGHLIEINNNPELLRRLNESSGFSYYDNTGEKTSTAEYVLMLSLKDGRLISIREFNDM